MERRTTLPDGFAASCKLAHGNCKPLCKEVAAAVAKDSKGYPERFQTWIALTNEAYPNTDPDPASIDSMRLTIIYSVRLISFFLMEIMACSETMQIKQEEYAFQLADLNVANVPVYEYVHDIQAFALNAQQRTQTSDLKMGGRTCRTPTAPPQTRCTSLTFDHHRGSKISGQIMPVCNNHPMDFNFVE